MKKTLLIMTLVLAAMSVSFPLPISAQTVMKTGVITKTPWLDRYYKVKIDNAVFTFMPNVQIDAYFADYQPQKMNDYLARKFRVGDRVSIARQGFRIYRIEFLNRK